MSIADVVIIDSYKKTLENRQFFKFCIAIAPNYTSKNSVDHSKAFKFCETIADTSLNFLSFYVLQDRSLDTVHGLCPAGRAAPFAGLDALYFRIFTKCRILLPWYVHIPA